MRACRIAVVKELDTGEPDAAVLSQLVKTGADHSKPHPVEFFLYLPTEAAAQEAASRIREMGFDAKVETSGQANSWVCFATKSIVPEVPALQNERSGTVIAMAITGQPQRAGFPLTVELMGGGLPKRYWVKVSQIRTLSVERLGKRIGRVTPAELLRVVEGLNEIIAA